MKLIYCCLLLLVVPLASAGFENWTRFDVYVVGAPDIFYGVANASVSLSFDYDNVTSTPRTISLGSSSIRSYASVNQLGGMLISGTLMESDAFGRDLVVTDSRGDAVPNELLLVIRTTNGNSTQSSESYFLPYTYSAPLRLESNESYVGQDTNATVAFFSSYMYGSDHAESVSLKDYARQRVKCEGDTLYVYVDSLPRYFMDNWSTYVYCDSSGCSPGWSASYPAGTYEFELRNTAGEVNPIIYICYTKDVIGDEWAYAWTGYGFWSVFVGAAPENATIGLQRGVGYYTEKYTTTDLPVIAADAIGTLLASGVFWIDLVIIVTLIGVLVFYIVGIVRAAK